ncbi:MAG: hypothetical protein JWP12_1632 [Bacteroidetes bacterium]|nr:hypothetical protein [Bacteroidota bacterium]
MTKITFKNYWLLLLLAILASSCSTSAFFYGPEKKLAYYPDTTIYHVEEINFKASDGKNLNGWFLKPKSIPVKATVLQLHGNGGNISYQYQFATPLIKAGYQVMVFDYEGYGNSEGSPSQEKVLDDATQALKYIKQREDVKNKKLILFGQSLGGHLACVVAAQNNNMIDALVVEAPFSAHKKIAVYFGHENYHLPSFIPKLLVPSKYDAIDYVDKITVPMLFIHSTEDQVCPYAMGCELYAKALGKKEFWQIKGGHIRASQLYPAEFVAHFDKLLDSI